MGFIIKLRSVRLDYEHYWLVRRWMRDNRDGGMLMCANILCIYADMLIVTNGSLFYFPRHFSLEFSSLKMDVATAVIWTRRPRTSSELHNTFVLVVQGGKASEGHPGDRASLHDAAARAPGNPEGCAAGPAGDLGKDRSHRENLELQLRSARVLLLSFEFRSGYSHWMVARYLYKLQVNTILCHDLVTLVTGSSPTRGISWHSP